MFRAAGVTRAFIGRQDELAALHEARRDLGSSRGGAVLIGGETGIGKSRLLGQFVASLREARSRRILVSAECLERVQQPFGPIRSLVSALVPEAAAGEVPPHVSLAVAQLTRSTLLEAGAEVLERGELFAALVDFVRLVVARKATILTVEDVQWADASTLDFLAYAVPRLSRSRFLLVATYRSDELERNEALFGAVSQLLREPRVRRFTLAALSKAEVRELVEEALDGRTTLPAAVRHDIELRSEGNPFFAEELVKSALEARNAAPSALPLSIRASIMQRLAMLSAEDRRILERAAVLGYRFDPAVLALVTDTDVEAILPTLRRARDLNIVLEESDPHARFRFRHALTRQTIYGGMLVFDARRLHAQILYALERLEDRDRYIDALAYHAWEAKDAAKTLEYNERAGDAALAQRALAEAALCFDRAREVASDDVDRARLAESAGSVASMQGRLSQGVDALEYAYDIRLKRGELDAAGSLCATIIIERNNLGDEKANVLGEKFLAEYGDALSVPVRDRLTVNVARLKASQYDFAGAERLLDKIDDRAKLTARARQNHLTIRLEGHFYRGDAEAWRALVPEFAGNLPDLPSEFQAIGFYTIAQMGTYMGANEIVERALVDGKRIERAAGYAAIATFGDSVRAAYLFLRGRLAEARANLERGLERPDIAPAAVMLAQLAPLLALASGDEGLVGRCVSPAVLETARKNIDVENAILLGAHAEWLGARGAVATAKSDLRLALTMFPSSLPTLGPVLVAAARLLDPTELATVRALAEAYAAGARNAACRATERLTAATVAARLGDRTEAASAALAAAELARTLEWPLFEARALEAAERHDEARALYARCEATAEVARFAAAPLRVRSEGAEGALSSREMDVARLVALGLTNKAISERLAVGQKTVEKHLASIFRKLEVSSRMHVAAFVLEQERATGDIAATS